MFTCGRAGPLLLPGLPLVAVGGGSSSVAACRLLVAVASCVAEHGLEAHGLQKPWLLGSRVLAQSLWCPPISGRQLCCAAEQKDLMYRLLDIFLPFCSVHGVLKARMLKWFAIPFSSGPRFVRTLHYDPSILGGPTWHGSQFHWVRQGCGPCDHFG